MAEGERLSEMSARKAAATIHSNGNDIFVSIDDVNIAKRGRPDRPQAGTWISIEPGWSVIDVGDLEGIEVRYQGAKVH
jgi:hypothetical protein